MIAEDLSCRELTEIVTDYLEGALPEHERLRFEEHIAACDGCTAYLDQMRTTIEVVGELCEDELDSHIRDELLRVFRDWKQHLTD